MAKIIDYATVGGAAKLCGAPEQSLRNAVAKGAIRTEPTADGVVMVRIKDVQRWMVKPRPRGRPWDQRAS